MRRITMLFALLVLPLLGSDSPKEYNDVTEVVGIEGTWRPTEIEYLGNKIDPPSKVLLTFNCGTNWIAGDTEQGNYRIDPTRKPPHLDLMPSSGVFKGKTVYLIYQIDGDTLRVAYFVGGSGIGRPQGFNEKGVMVSTFKRVKK